MEGTKGESNPDADAASVNPTAIFGAETVKTVSKIPLLTVRAGPRDKVGKLVIHPLLYLLGHLTRLYIYTYHIGVPR
jgi:hypothetical protein